MIFSIYKDLFPDSDGSNIGWVHNESLEGREDSLSQAMTRHHEPDHFSAVLREPGNGHHGYHCEVRAISFAIRNLSGQLESDCS